MKEFFRMFAATAIDILGSIITTFIIFKIANPNTLGIYSRMVSLALLVSSLAILGIDVVVRYYLPKGYDVSPLMGISIIALGIASIVLLFFEPISAILAFFSGLYTMHIAYALASRNYGSYFKIVFFRRSLQPIIVPLAFYLYGPKIAALVLSITFSPSVVVIRHATFKLPSFGIKEAFWSVLTRIVSSLSIYADKIFTALLYGYAILGVFYFVRQLGMMVAVIVGAFDRYALQEISAGKSVNREFILVLILTAIVGVSLYVFRSLVARLFPNFSQYVYLLRTVAIFVVLRAIGAYLKAIALGRKRFELGFLAQAMALIGILATIYFSRGSLVWIALSPAVGQLVYILTILPFIKNQA